MKKNKVLAVITARGGSKRLPNKNIRVLSNKPLIGWTIEAALKSKSITKTIVSTDNKKIAEISKNCGADVPFIRPNYLANDTAKSYDVLLHSLSFYEKQSILFDYIIMLQPTSPLRTNIHIDEAFKLINKETKGVVSVCNAEHSPLWCNTLPDNLNMSGFIDESIANKRSQDLPVYYRLNGAIYIAEVNYYKHNKGFISTQTKAYIMRQNNSIDIDTIEDFKYAEYLVKKHS